MGFQNIKLFDDPTNGLINLRFIRDLMALVEYSDLTDNEKEQFFNLLILTGKKLAMVWGHLNSYKRYEEQLINNAQQTVIKKQDHIISFEPSQELFFEFDEFLIQVKSCLDYLVKFPAITLGTQRWTLRTFGDKGNDVIKALENNLPKDKEKIALGIIHFLKKHQPWLDGTITARDKINHFIDGGVDFKNFIVINFEGTIKTPMWSPEQKIRDFMITIWTNIFYLCEDFVATSIFLRFNNNYVLFHGSSNLDLKKSPWQVTTKERMQIIVKQPGWEVLQEN